MFKISSRINFLRETIAWWNHRYYVEDNPVVSDRDWQKHYDELVALEKRYPQYDSPSSPTKVVGGYVSSSLKKVEHKYVMLSLDKFKSIDNILGWHKKIGSPIVVVSNKADGLAIELLYLYNHTNKMFVLERAATRGDGVVGEDVTHNAMVIDSIPKSFVYEIKTTTEIVVYGEVVVPKNKFKQINSKLSKENAFKTARNLAAGSMRQLSSSVCKERGLAFVAYGGHIPFSCELESTLFVTLASFGFKTVEHFVTRKSKEIKDAIDKLESLTKRNSYDIDGVVIKVDERVAQMELGSSSKSPRYAMCYKFEDDEYETKLQEVVWAVSRTGRINPTGIISPVIIDGTEVSRVTLNNIDFIEGLGLDEGDTIVIRKANMVIPEIVDNLSAKIGNTIDIPKKCPHCGSDIIVVKKEVRFLYCSNVKNCGGVLLAAMTHFCSRDAINIDGLSESKLNYLMTCGFINSLTDIMCLPKIIVEFKKKGRYNLEMLPGWGKKSVYNLVKSIEDAKTTTLERFIYSLGITGVGYVNARELCDAFEYDFDLMLVVAKSKEALMHKGLGDVVSTEISKFFSSNRDVVKNLSKQFIFEDDAVAVVSSKLNGKVFCITGKYDDMSRDAFSELVVSNGGVFSDQVNKGTDYLVVGENAGSGKITQAEKYKIKQLSTKEFSDMVK